MIQSTFCHIPGIGIPSERHLWSLGIHTWEDLNKVSAVRLPSNQKVASLSSHITKSFQQLGIKNPHYFSETLPLNQHWRLFREFRDSTVFLDIETTGLSPDSDHITTIALYDGKSVFHYVYGKNLEDFKQDVQKYSLIITYYGKRFDVPFIERYFNIKLNHAHIDLCFVLRSLGYKGGLKGCEQKFGLDRKELSDIDGLFAVRLWEDYKTNNNQKALETLLAYNIRDAVVLETLMVNAYNLKLNDTPFLQSHTLHIPSFPTHPFKADKITIAKIKREREEMLQQRLAAASHYYSDEIISKGLKLTIELIPEPSWGKNIRKVVSRSTWDRIRKETYAYYGDKCGICGAEENLDCHEIWNYDDLNYIQKLEGFIALCDLCHCVKHLGRADIEARRGKLDMRKVMRHFMNINGCNAVTFIRHRFNAHAQWRRRSRHEWFIDLGEYGSIATRK